jgi:DNA/RNA endonuclease G (NUC1)
MKILTTSSSAQTIKVIPREYITSGTLTVRNDTTNTSTNYSISASTIDDDLSFNVTFSPVLKEGFYYDMTLKNSSSKIIYKDKIFCTDQTINQTNNNYYTVNSGEYTTQNTYDDDYITL